jgi:hypothetical protein
MSMRDLVTKFADQLKERGLLKIYLSHDPFQEKEARIFANELEQIGITVVVAADVRPHKDGVHDKSDLEVVKRAMESCDAIVRYELVKRSYTN